MMQIMNTWNKILLQQKTAKHSFPPLFFLLLPSTLHLPLYSSTFCPTMTSPPSPTTKRSTMIYRVLLNFPLPPKMQLTPQNQLPMPQKEKYKFRPLQLLIPPLKSEKMLNTPINHLAGSIKMQAPSTIYHLIPHLSDIFPLMKIISPTIFPPKILPPPMIYQQVSLLQFIPLSKIKIPALEKN